MAMRETGKFYQLSALAPKPALGALQSDYFLSPFRPSEATAATHIFLQSMV